MSPLPSTNKPSFPTFVPLVNSDVRSNIHDELDSIKTQHDVTILFAIESGSRAWGFPSLDSDYDVRFVYVHKTDRYLSINPGRDVIERPISNALDISGWDLMKALALMLKPNPVMLEWLSSPIRYVWRKEECERLITFSKKPAHSSACLHHYLNLGRSQFDLHFERERKVKLKKYFYVLRPALAIRWMRLHPERIPPMNIQALVRELDIAPSVLETVDGLIGNAAMSEEIEDFQRIPKLDQFITDEFEWADQAKKEKVKQNLTTEADALFRDIVRMTDVL